MSSLHLFHLRQWLLQSPPVEWVIQRLRELLIGAVRQGPVPQHVAFIMDGNRRFARSRQIETVEGHNLGFEALARILEVCYNSGIKVVTVYAFSLENFKRSKYEVDGLLNIAKMKLTQLAQHGDLLDQYGASIRLLGQRNLIRPDVLEALDKAIEMTSGNTRAVLNISAPYTSRDEITTAIRNTVIDYTKPPLHSCKRPFSESRIARNIRSQRSNNANEDEKSPSRAPSPIPLSEEGGEEVSVANNSSFSTATSTTLNPSPSGSESRSRSPASLLPVLTNLPDPETITANTLTDHMFTAGNPPLDLLIRTSGVERLSDFMLWQCHKDTSIVFLDCYWPEFDLWHFLPVLLEWQTQKIKERAEDNRRLEKRAKKRRQILA